MATTRSSLPVDRLRHPRAMVEVVVLRGADIGADAERVRDPHRHDYHELLWVSAGSGRHRIDQTPNKFAAGSVTLIGRGQVHVFERARDVAGAVVRFREEMLADCGGLAWMLHTIQSQVAEVPPPDRVHLDGLIAALAAEIDRPPEADVLDLQRHLLAAILLLVERWLMATGPDGPDASGGAVQLHRRFSAQLESDYRDHHDAAHYADALRVPAAALSRALVEVTGRTTKESISDRIMLEAARLLLFTELSVGEIAHRVGYRDQLYFSRAFRRRRGMSPSAFRDRGRSDGGQRSRS